LGREMYSLTIDQTLQHLEGVVSQVNTQVNSAVTANR
jgi:hypothetical protein